MASEKETPSNIRKKKRLKQIAIILFVLFNIFIIYWTASKELARDKTMDASDVHLHVWLLIPAVIAFVCAIFSDFYK